jgi:predicted ATPase/class 3 adenylate cyclase
MTTPAADRPELPTGTVTFLFTDVEGSTLLAQRTDPDVFRHLIETHLALVRIAVEDGDGIAIRTEGDALFAVFAAPGPAIEAAVAAQQALLGHDWPDGEHVRARMGLHTGEGRLGGDDYIGIDVHRAARISATGHGGQIVVSADAVGSTGPELPAGTTVVDLGRYRLKDLIAPEHLYQVVGDGLPADFPALRTSAVSPHKLPKHLTSFVGRAAEMDRAKEIIRAEHLLTFTGPGGTGKTRLAGEVAAGVSDDFPDGAFFVPLSDLRDPDAVVPAVLDVLEVAWSRDLEPLPQLIRHLEDRRVLLLLDNYEHVLTAAPVVSELLAAVPQLRVIVTSRAPLRIGGEHEYPVVPLPVPGPGEEADVLAYDAVRLFVDRARAADPGFAVTDRNSSAIARITARLDGLPLAIELVAARVRAMPPEIAVDRLEGRMVAGGGRDLPERQRTLFTTIAWSYDLLDAPQQRFFENLGVFGGGASLDQIEAVNPEVDAADSWEALVVLIDNSLVARVDAHGEPRFGMLGLVGEYAAERLAVRPDVDETRARHAEAYLALAARAAPELTGPHRAIWLQQMGDEHENLAAALEWAIETPSADVALRLVGAMWRFWQMDGHLDAGARLAAAALALDGGVPQARGRALEAAGGLAYWRGDFSAQFDYYRVALSVWRDLDDSEEIANACFNLAYATQVRDGFEAASALLTEAERRFREAGNAVGLGRVYWAWANLFQVERSFERAVEYCERAIGHFDPTKDAFDLGWAEFVMAECLLKLGRVDDATHHLRSGMARFLDAGDLSAMVLFLHAFAELSRQSGDIDTSARLVGVMRSLRDETGTGLVDSDPAHQSLTDPPEAALPEYQQALVEGAALSIEEAAAMAMMRTAG